MELKTLYGGSVDIRTHQPAGEVGVVKGVAKDGAPKIRQYPYWVSDGGTLAKSYRTVRHGRADAITAPAGKIILQTSRGSAYDFAEYVVLDEVPNDGQIRPAPKNFGWVLGE
ncbi:MAG: hypothetical protein A3H70_04995 [Candidatus Komeilibacteria bacterium RIFCSPLOWO2_02_FULL_48_11]|uniref:Uncharacterized protein n=1 Tax=Candidatus Komeilibacteria bacterium RIFCSPLOWO2_02_FULL_48_11 TaxID=1798553 RepID=A0A1G2BUS9_9BACT|nr:MAG: hypothetical protein A3H70_04995 [Candidatus Komeilibacteria bacterium RIFCSPLOWO2_02_FULL_48_11]